MMLCRVTGSVVSTVKHPKFVGHRMMVVQPVELDAKTPVGPSYPAVDLVQAGVGDLVLTIIEGGGVKIVFQDDKVPLAALITAIVDELEVEDEPTLIGTSVLERGMSERAEG